MNRVLGNIIFQNRAVAHAGRPIFLLLGVALLAIVAMTTYLMQKKVEK